MVTTARAPPRPKLAWRLREVLRAVIAHIGVLRTFRDAGIPIDCVAGTSVGALIGAGFCSGISLEKMHGDRAVYDLCGLRPLDSLWLGLATNLRMEKYLARMTPATTFAELKNSPGHQRYGHQCRRDDLLPEWRDCSRRSAPPAAYPGLFVHIQYEGRTLVDGFLTAPSR